jgi:hypothetical protein
VCQKQNAAGSNQGGLAKEGASESFVWWTGKAQMEDEQMSRGRKKSGVFWNKRGGVSDWDAAWEEREAGDGSERDSSTGLEGAVNGAVNEWGC